MSDDVDREEAERQLRWLIARRRDHEQHKQMLRGGATWIDGHYLDRVGSRRLDDGSYVQTYRWMTTESAEESVRIEGRGEGESEVLYDLMKAWERREKKRKRKTKREPRVVAVERLGATTLAACGHCHNTADADTALDTWYWISHRWRREPVALCCSRVCADLCSAARSEEDERVIDPLCGWDRTLVVPYEIVR